MRSFLTMLGIIIGVAAVIIIVSLMSSLTNYVISTFEDMGANLITVSISGRGGNRSVSPEEMQELALDNPDIIGYISPSLSVPATAKVGNTNVTLQATGVNEYYDEIKQQTLQAGRSLSFTDINERSKNCVIGTYLVKELFDGQNPLEQTLTVNGVAFTVVGVLEETASSTSSSSDNTLLIPYTTAKQIGRGNINTYSVSAATKDTIDATNDLLERFLLEKFDSDDYFTLIDQAAIIEELNKLIGMMTTMLVGIAAVSLLVGGIGVMNIMLVSVTERTREIGIRKSLGATPWDILGQFLVEACVTSGIGGIIGIGLGIGGASIAANLIGIPFTLSVPSILVAFSVSAAIGIGFGYFPARKASRLNPIDALRYE
ncbi:MAG: FtsX-like permease family protein [Ruminococcaceae bacterium]|nr:FtsX-like permease family protein [Oscillospiraceae bacterium]